MKRILIATLAAALTFALPLQSAEAKRLAGGGMKRSVPTQPAPQAPTPQQPAPGKQQAAPTPAAPITPAAAPAKRSWLGPVAGIAAGLGLAALASHFGFGAGLANLMTVLLLALVAFAVLRFVMRRFAPAPQPQLAPAGGAPFAAPASVAPVAPAAAASTDFDAAGFEKIAKQVFIRLQAANDAGDQSDLRRFTTPQMYASIQHDLLERQGKTQRTEVLQLDARVVDVATEAGEPVVSVRFWGLVREASEQAAEDFDEIWHLVRATGGDGWLIAGIQQTA